MATIKGVWKFNDNLVRDTNLIGNTYTVKFTGVEGWLGSFDRIRFSQYANTMNFPTSYYGLKMDFRYVGETSYRTIYESNTTPKWDYPTQTVDFGESEQTVSDTFYSWLTANAVRLFSEYSVKRETLTAIADSIRAKTGGSNPILTEDMASEIEGIETGITPTGTLEITENGTYDVTEKAQVNVAVPTPAPTYWDGSYTDTDAVEETPTSYTVTVNGTLTRDSTNLACHGYVAITTEKNGEEIERLREASTFTDVQSMINDTYVVQGSCLVIQIESADGFTVNSSSATGDITIDNAGGDIGFMSIWLTVNGDGTVTFNANLWDD